MNSPKAEATNHVAVTMHCVRSGLRQFVYEWHRGDGCISAVAALDIIAFLTEATEHIEEVDVYVREIIKEPESSPAQESAVPS
jgi:hypothetical protein